MKSYKDMVRDAPKDKKIMAKSVDIIDSLMGKLWKENPSLARQFMFSQWELVYGPYYDEALAKEEVMYMHHTESDGSIVKGEVIPYDEVMPYVPQERREHECWNAYVAFNGFAHDLAHAKMTKQQVMDAAHSFWFMDDDYPEGKNKIWNYYKNL